MYQWERIEPQAGNSLHLTLDSDLQRIGYHLLEQYIAGILWSNIVDTEYFDAESAQSADEVITPVYDVYYSLF